MSGRAPAEPPAPFDPPTAREAYALAIPVGIGATCLSGAVSVAVALLLALYDVEALARLGGPFLAGLTLSCAINAGVGLALIRLRPWARLVSVALNVLFGFVTLESHGLAVALLCWTFAGALVTPGAEAWFRPEGRRRAHALVLRPYVEAVAGFGFLSSLVVALAGEPLEPPGALLCALTILPIVLGAPMLRLRPEEARPVLQIVRAVGGVLLAAVIAIGAVVVWLT